MYVSSSYVCPAGYDCVFANSCPKPVLPCPEGFFCSSYEGHPNQDLIDYHYADSIGAIATIDNADKYAPPGRFIQGSCIQQFSCPNATTIEGCPAGHWCSEDSVVPLKCDGLSYCPELAGYQINFVDALIMMLLTITIGISSVYYTRDQHRKQSATRTLSSRAVPTNRKLYPEPSVEPETQQEQGIDVVFHNIKCSKGGHCILPNVSGLIPANKLTCILGPMSCGKSTVLECIRERCAGCEEGTSVLLRAGKALHLTSRAYSRYVGLVPQEDILDRSLTVREVLVFNAMTRLPELYPTVEAANGIVERVLNELAIRHIADTVIGGGPNSPANISGGQVKRVNIAMELVALNRPSVLLLDEPTSGLDAAVALDLTESLRSLAEEGITVLMVLQQPRPEIFESLDQVMLMQSDGSFIYQGSSKTTIAYLASIGFSQPEETSDADFCIDVLNRLIDMSSTDLVEKGTNNSDSQTNLLTLWQNSDMKAELDFQNKEYFASISDISPELSDATFTDDCMSFCNTLKLSAQRLVTIRLRSQRNLIIYFAIQVIMAAALSAAFSIIIQSSYKNVLVGPIVRELAPYYPAPLQHLHFESKNMGDLGFTQLLFFMSGSIGCAASLATVPVFSGENALTKRLVKSGLSAHAIGIGKILADAIFVLFNAIVFTGTWTVFGHAGSFYNWILVVVAASYAASGIGYICGVLGNPTNASVYAIIITFTFCVFSGVEPTLQQLKDLVVLNWVWYASFATWTAEITYITWSEYLRNDHGEDTVPIGAHHFGYEVNSIGRSIGLLILIGTAMRGIAIWLLNHNARK